MRKDTLQQILSEHCSGAKLLHQRPVGGGCINHAIQLETDKGKYFLKFNTQEKGDLFSSEVKGLQLLEANSPLKTPKVIAAGKVEAHSYLLLEWVASGHASSKFWEDFGSGLAELHQTPSDHFGLDHDNYIGSLPQINNRHSNWADFFIAERLEPQLTLAASKALTDKGIQSDFQRLFNQLEGLIPDEQPALLHGDLWSGNFMTNEHSKPVLIDPAVHFGHRETEIAFTHLFGGFDSKFYRTYQLFYPLAPGFEERIELHNLYPLLVHVNLFGASYLSGIKQTLKRFT